MKKIKFLPLIIFGLLLSIFILSRSDFILNIIVGNNAKKTEVVEKKSFTNNIQDFFIGIASKMIEKKLNDNGFLSKFEQEIFEDEKLSMKTYQEGEGNPVFCGQLVTVDITSFNDNNLEDVRYYQDLDLRLGEGSFNRELEYGILGMKLNEIRQIELDSLADGHIKHEIYKVVMKKIPLESSFNIEDLIILEQKNKASRAAMCGDIVSFQFKLLDARGQEFFNSSILSTRIGSKELPLPIELGLQKTTEDSQRIVIVPPKFFTAHYKNIAEDVSILEQVNDNEITIVELNVLKVQKNKKSSTVQEDKIAK